MEPHRSGRRRRPRPPRNGARRRARAHAWLNAPDQYDPALDGDYLGLEAALGGRAREWVRAWTAGHVDEALKATPFVWKNPATLPRRQWLYGRHYIRRYLSLTVAPGGVGKSSLAVTEALAMATRRPLLEIAPDNTLKVWLFNGEDPREELERRVAATCLHYGLRAEHLADRLFLDSGREQEVTIARESKRAVEVAVPTVDAIKRTLAANKIDVLIVDPFVSTHGVPENDNGAIDRVAKLWAQIADETDTSVEIIHHVKKTEGREVTAEDARGAISLIAAARSVRVLNPMTAEEADRAGIAETDRGSLFRVAVGKANLAPRDNRSDWRRIESVGLGNGTGLQKPQDFVGVVTPWQWPSVDDVMEDISPTAMEAIKTRLAGGTYRDGEQSPAWGGHVVAEVLGLDLSEPVAKKQVKSLIAAWKREGVLEVITRLDEQRRKRRFLVPAGYAPPP